jgi:hypothetical protein
MRRRERARLWRPTASGRRRAAALSGTTQVSVAVVACALWVALAMPGLQLVPGVGRSADADVAISLQSALLGIDDGGRSHLSASQRASLRALGLDPSKGALSRALLRDPGTTSNAALVAQVDASIVSAGDSATPSDGPGDAPSPPSAPASDSATEPTLSIAPRPKRPVHSPTPATPPVTPPPTSSPKAPVAPKPQPPAPQPAPPPVAPRTAPPTAPPTGPPALLLQSIVFTTTPPANALAGSTPYVVAAIADSGLPVAFDADPASAGICTVSGSSVVPIGPGTCVVDADQPGDARYLAAARVRQSFLVRSPAAAARSVQTIAFTSSPPTGAVIGGAPYVLAATASSSLPVTFSLSSGSAGVCTLAGSVVSFVGSGTCRVFADQSGNGSYLAASEEQQAFAVGLVPQTIVFASTPPAGAVVGDPAYDVVASASSGLAVVFSAAPASAGVCTVTGSSVVPVGAGTCLLNADQFGNATYRAAVVQQSFTVGAGAASQSVQTIQMTSTPPAGAVIGGSPYTVSATASSGLPVTLAVEPASAGVCTLAGTTVSFTGAGTCTVDADQSGNSSYLPAAQVQQSFAVGLVPQSISFGSTPPPNALVGDAPYAVAASSSSGIAVGFTAAPSSAGVCTVTGTDVTLVGTGTCTIDADQPGNATYAPAVTVQQSFTVRAPSLSIQSINFTSSPPPGAVVGGATYTVSATASSGLPVSFSLGAGSAGVCTLTGSTVSFVGAGTCTVNANQGGDASYLPAPESQQSFSVSLRTQTISFTSMPPAGAVVGDPAYAVGAAAGSGLAVTFTAAPSSAGVCTVAGASVTLVGVGTCTINANQSGNASYGAAAQVQQSFAVAAPSASGQTITFTTTAPSGATIGGPAYIVAASASSGLGVSFSLAAGSAGVCTLSGSTVSFVGAGTCTIDADQAGNASYAAASQAHQSFAVGLTGQAIAFTSSPPVGANAGDPAYAVSATASSGLAVTFSAAASSAGICTVSGSAVALVGVGTCTIDANQAGDATHAAAPQAQQSFSIGIAAAPSVQSITFTSAPPSGATAGGGPYPVSASASSGLAVTFSADASSAGVCTVSGATVTVVGVGTCTVDADQSGNASYAAAAQAQQSFAVSLAPQTISFSSVPPGGANVGDPAYAVAAGASSGLAVTLTIDGSSAGACTISGGAVTFVAAGTCTVDADQAGNGTYGAAPRAQQSFAVTNPAPSQSVQSIAFTTTAPATAAVGGAGYTAAASASSGLPVALTVDASSAGVCTLAGSTVSFTSTGTCTIDANQAGDASYLAAPQVQQSIAVGLAAQTISFTSAPPGGATAGGATYIVSATASSGLAVTFGIAPGSAGVCTLSGSVVSFTAAGTCTIRANQAGNGAYAAAPQAQQSFTVGAAAKSVQTIQFTSSAPSGAVVGSGTYVVAATASSGLAVALSVDASSAGVCTLAGSTVSFVGAGTCTIDANQTGNASYAAAPQAQQSFAVSLRSQAISFLTQPPASPSLGGSYDVSASATSGLTVAYAVSAGSAGVCTISGSHVSMIGAGTCVVTANQSGNGTYRAAAQVEQSFTIPRASQTITFTSTTPNADKHDPPYTVTATASSGLAVVFSVDASSAGVCSISGSTVSFSARGTCVIYANEGGDADWLPAPQVQQVIEVKNHTPG